MTHPDLRALAGEDVVVSDADNGTVVEDRDDDQCEQRQNKRARDLLEADAAGHAVRRRIYHNARAMRKPVGW